MGTLKAEQPQELRRICLAISTHIHPVAHSSSGGAILPTRYKSKTQNPSSSAYEAVIELNAKKHSKFTYHQPWPSRNIPQGNPISCLQRRIVPQYLMSNAQIPNPPRKIERPMATINHISFNIRVSLCAFAKRSDFDNPPTGFCGAVAYFRFNDGRIFTSILLVRSRSQHYFFRIIGRR